MSAVELASDLTPFGSPLGVLWLVFGLVAVVLVAGSFSLWVASRGRRP